MSGKLVAISLVVLLLITFSGMYMINTAVDSTASSDADYGVFSQGMGTSPDISIKAAQMRSWNSILDFLIDFFKTLFKELKNLRL